MIDDPLETAWQKVLAEWEDERAHKAFVMLASGTGRLGEAGRRYRRVRDEEPPRAAVAQREMDRVVSLAMQTLAEHKTEPPKRGARGFLLAVAFAVMSALILSAAYALLRTR